MCLLSGALLLIAFAYYSFRFVVLADTRLSCFGELIFAVALFITISTVLLLPFISFYDRFVLSYYEAPQSKWISYLLRLLHIIFFPIMGFVYFLISKNKKAILFRSSIMSTIFCGLSVFWILTVTFVLKFLYPLM